MLVKNFLFIFLLITCKLHAQAFIKGTITDSQDNHVFIFEPLNGYFNSEIPDTVAIIKSGNEKKFERKINISYPTQLSISVGPLYCPITIFPGDTIDVALNVDTYDTTWAGRETSIIYSGKNKAGNETFNKYNYPGLGMKIDFENDLRKVNFWGGIRRIEQFDSVLKNQVVRYDRLLQEKKLTRQFYNFIIKVICQFLLTSSIRDVRTAKNTTLKEKLAFIGKMFDYYKLQDNDPVLYNNFYWNSIAGERYAYKRVLKEKVAYNFANTTITVDGNRFFLNGNLAYWQEAPKPLQEFFWAQDLLFLKQLFSGSYDQKDVDTYLAVFPNSPYKKYLVPPFYGFLPWTEKDSAQVDIIRPGNADNIDSVLNKHFKNQNVLIDLWATWCAPCKQEFKYVKEIDVFCSKNNIQRLYISLDREREPFIRDIYAYQLAGKHIMITYSLQQDIVNRFYLGKEDNLTIPRYVLVNSKGKIVDANLLRPNTGNAFYKTVLRKLYP